MDDLAGRGVHIDDGTDESRRALAQESFLTSSAADFFSAKVFKNMPENYENHLFSQMMDSAVLWSAALADEQRGDVQDGKNNFSYFDVKMLRNRAGPGHWEFPFVRKVQRVQIEADKDALVVDEEVLARKAELPVLPMDRGRKGSTAGVDEKATSLISIVRSLIGQASRLERFNRF